MWLTGTSRKPAVEVGGPPVISGGISAPMPLPSPLGRATAYLLGQLLVGHRAPRRRVEGADGLPEGWGLAQSDGSRDHVATDAVTEVLANLSHDLVGQLGPGVVHDEHDGGHLEAGVEV